MGIVVYFIIKNDSIWFEKYYDGYVEDFKFNFFFMVKSMVMVMLGKVIMDGYIESLD